MTHSIEKPHPYWFAICGFNFAIVAGLFVGFFGWLLGRWRGMLAAFLGIALYAALAGASAGVVRAAIMGGLGVFAAQIGRRQYGLNSLFFVAALMALADPHVLEALEGRTLLRTDRNGWIELSTDGENLWVEVERK